MPDLAITSTDISFDDTAKQDVQDKDNPVQECAQEINAVLAKHGLQFDVSILLRAGQVIPNINLVPVQQPNTEPIITEH